MNISAAKGQAVKIGRACGMACTTAGRWLLRIAAIGAAGLSTFAIMMMMILAGEGVSLGIIEPTVEGIIKDRMDAKRVSIDSIRLVRDQKGAAPLRLTLTDVEIDQGDKGKIEIPVIALRLEPQNLIRKQFIPQMIEVDGAALRIERGGEGLSVGGESETGDPIDVKGALQYMRQAGFEGAYFRNFEVTYVNADTGASFELTDSDALLTQSDKGYTAELRVPDAANASDILSLDLNIDENTGHADILLTADDAPMASLMPLFLGRDDSVQFDGDVSGTIKAEGVLPGSLEELQVNLHVGEGELEFGGRAMQVTELQVRGAFEPLEGRLVVDRLRYDLGQDQGLVRGNINLIQKDGTLSEISYELAGEGVQTDGLGLYEERILIPTSRFVGRFDMAERTIFLEELEAAYFDAKVTGSMSFALPLEDGQSAGLKADLLVDGTLTPQQVVYGWPPELGQPAREWVDLNMPSARVDSVKYKMNIERGTISSGEALTEDSIDLRFHAHDATIIYVPGLPPIKGIDATGHIKGLRFTVDAKGGRVGSIKVIDGDILMAEMATRGAPANFRVKVSGDGTEMLRLLDKKPLSLLSAAGFDPAAFTGDAIFDLHVMRPLLSEVPLRDYEFSGEGAFDNGAAEINGLPWQVTDARGTIKLTDDGIQIGGNALLDQVPTDFDWQLGFWGKQKTELTANAELDSIAADALGLPLRRFIRGFVDTKVKMWGINGKLRHLHLDGDLLNAAITLDDRDFIKREGEPGTASVDLLLGEEGDPLTIEAMNMKMAGANIEGNALLARDTTIIDLDLPRLFIENYADLSLRLRRDERDLDISMEGDYLYAGQIIEDFMSSGGGGSGESETGLPGKVDLDVSIAEVGLKGAVTLNNMELKGQHNGVTLDQLTLGGQFEDGGALSMEVMENLQGIGKDVRVVTDEFGKLIEGVFGIATVRGGNAIFTATAVKEGPLAGTLKASGIRIQRAPTIAQLLSLGSLTGFADTLNGEGIAFDELTGDVQFEDGALKLVDARMTGSSLGLSANGSVDFSNNEFAMHGAVAPAYGVNSFVKNIPGIGDILVSRQGEGVFAFAYRVDGPVVEPTVSVNALTALTPGILRRVFEPVPGETLSTNDILTAAEATERMQEAREFLSTPELLQEYEALQQQRETNVDEVR